MMAYRPGTAAVAIVTVVTMALAGCRDATDAGAPVSTADKAAAGSESSEPTEPTNAIEGTPSLPPADIVQAARTALHQAKSFYARGTLRGKHATVANGDSEEVEIEVVGKDYYESFLLGGSKVEVLLVGGHVYTRAEPEFYVAIESAAPGDSRQWIHLGPPEDAFGESFRRLDIDGLFKLTGTLSVDTTDVGAQNPSVTVADGSGAALIVAAFNEPYPILAVAADESSLEFSGYGKSFAHVKKPRADQINDFYEWGTNLDH